MGARTGALQRVHFAAETYPLPKDIGAGKFVLPTPPGPLLDLVSTGNTPGAYTWGTAANDTVGSVPISATSGVVIHNADTTGGIVAYTLPPASSVPNGGSVETFLAVSSGANAMTVAPTGGDQIMNPDTGVYQAGVWSTAPSGNQQGRGVTWVSDGVSKWTAH